VLRPYVELLRMPGAGRLVAASLTGRLCTGILSLPLILLAREASGSYAAAGAAAGAFSVGVAVSAPLRGRRCRR
jgi:hypothetical protein